MQCRIASELVIYATDLISAGSLHELLHSRILEEGRNGLCALSCALRLTHNCWFVLTRVLLVGK